MRVIALLVALALPVGAEQFSPGQTPAQSPAAPVVSETLAVQIMLDRANFSPGEIDSRDGANLKRALTAFQTVEKLTGAGKLNRETWDRLSERSGSQPPLVPYTVTDADIAGPFTPDIPTDLVEQSKLAALGFTSPLEMLAERFHASPTLLKTLNPSATFARAGESLTVPNIAGAAVPAVSGAISVVVTRATGALTVEDTSGRVVLHAPVTSGSKHDPLPLGTWKVTGVQQNPSFHYNPALFWDADPAHSKATLAPGPNNPVGTVWIDISKEHYGIHGTPSPSAIGHVESHGCVRLTNWDAQRLAALVKPGTKVVFR